MKKSILIVLGTLTLVAGAAETTVESKNSLGIKRTAYTSNSEIAVGVPWLKAADKEGVTVAELIKTGITEGDQIQVYDLEAKTYFSWKYDGEKEKWEGATPSKGEGVAATKSAEEYTLQRGTAFWYKPASEKGAFTQVGTYSDAAITTKVNKVHADGETVGTFANPVHNLLVNPKYEEYGIAALNGKCAENDVIIVLNTGARYRYNGGVWGQDIDQKVTQFGVTVTQKVFTAIGKESVIPVGTAFWYLSAGGKPEIEW